MMTFDQFIKWEAASKDTIDFKRVYAHMAGDALAGLMLSQIVFWHLPSDKTGETKLRVEKDGNLWMAVPREDWFEAICVTARQADRLISQLSETCQNDAGDTRLPLVEAKLFKFAGTPTPHIRLLHENFLTVLALCLDGQSFIQKHKPRGKATLLISKVEDDNKTVKSTSLISKVASQISKVDLTKQESPLTETTYRDYTETTNREKEGEAAKAAAQSAPPVKPSKPVLSEPKKPVSRQRKEPPEETAYYAECVPVVARVCRIDLAITGEWARCKKPLQALYHATIRPTPELLAVHYERPTGYWYAHDFRGLKGDPPEPHWIQNTWGKATSGAPRVVNGNGPPGRQYRGSAAAAMDEGLAAVAGLRAELGMSEVSDGNREQGARGYSNSHPRLPGSVSR